MNSQTPGKELDWQEFQNQLDEAIFCWLVDHTEANLWTEFMDFSDYVNRRRLEQNRPTPVKEDVDG